MLQEKSCRRKEPANEVVSLLGNEEYLVLCWVILSSWAYRVWAANKACRFRFSFCVERWTSCCYYRNRFCGSISAFSSHNQSVKLWWLALLDFAAGKAAKCCRWRFPRSGIILVLFYEFVWLASYWPDTLFESRLLACLNYVFYHLNFVDKPSPVLKGLNEMDSSFPLRNPECLNGVSALTCKL